MIQVNIEKARRGLVTRVIGEVSALVFFLLFWVRKFSVLAVVVVVFLYTAFKFNH